MFVMPFYSFEMILVGIILLSAMTLGGIKLWLKKRADLVTKPNPINQDSDSSKLENTSPNENYSSDNFFKDSS